MRKVFLGITNCTIKTFFNGQNLAFLRILLGPIFRVDHFSVVTSFPVTPLMIIHLSKDFMDSSRPVSFFINLRNFRYDPSFQSFCLDNTKTKERLVLKGMDQPFQQFPFVTCGTFARHPMQANEQWVEEMRKELDPEYESRIIKVEI
jgi:hypothetical protein